jgi:hypothetical protein
MEIFGGLVSTVLAEALPVAERANQQRFWNGVLSRSACMRLFLDTEWQNDESRELVSIALLSHDGRHCFYAERDPLPSEPSSFVRDVVYPLLDRGSAAMKDLAFSHALHDFLCRLDDPLVIADSPMDFRLLSSALDDFGRKDRSSPPPWRPKLVTHEEVQRRIEGYFDSNPFSRARRHHALVDAEALRWAFEGAPKPESWGPLE